jgi:hypothetical protein
MNFQLGFVLDDCEIFGPPWVKTARLIKALPAKAGIKALHLKDMLFNDVFLVSVLTDKLCNSRGFSTRGLRTKHREKDQ